MEEKKYNYAYFNIVIEKSKEYKIYLSPEYKDSETLEKIEEKDYIAIFDPRIIRVYRFKINPEYLEKKMKKMNMKLML